MKRDLPQYVVRLRGVIYFKRRGWQTRKFEAQEVGPAFYKEYARILNGTASVPVGDTVKALINDYYRSFAFERLADRTKADYRKYLDRLERNAGTIEVKAIERRHVIAWRDALAKSQSPHYANYFLRVLRLLLEHAVNRGQIPTNPARGKLAIGYKSQKPKPWPKELIAAARAARPYEDRTRLLFELLYCTGQRIGDVLKMRWVDLRGDAIDVTQGKTDAELLLPLTDDLRECLRRADREGETILTAHQKDTPWSYRGASDAMMKLRKEIHAEAFTIHAIRHTVASEIAAGEGDDDEIMAVTGHTTKAMVAHYAGSARQRVRAEKAQKRRK